MTVFSLGGVPTGWGSTFACRGSTVDHGGWGVVCGMAGTVENEGVKIMVVVGPRDFCGARSSGSSGRESFALKRLRGCMVAGGKQEKEGGCGTAGRAGVLGYLWK